VRVVVVGATTVEVITTVLVLVVVLVDQLPTVPPLLTVTVHDGAVVGTVGG
jgi:hypothetical protein